MCVNKQEKEKEMNLVVPESLNLDYDSIAKGAMGKTMREGAYCKFLITREERKASARGHLMVACTMSPLTDPDDNGSAAPVSVRSSLCLPVANPDVPGHKAPNTGGLCREFISAFLVDTVGTPPVYDRETRTFSFRGKDGIPGELGDELKVLYSNRCCEIALAVYTGELSLVGASAFGLVAVNDEGYTNVVKLRANKDPEIALTDPSEFFVEKSTDSLRYKTLEDLLADL